MSQDEALDGVEREVRRAGDEPPDIPTESALEDLLPRLLEGVDEVATGYLVRASLPGEDPERASERLVDALERKVTVLGSTLDAGIDPADPQVDVLIQCEYTASQVASALGGVTPVRGAVVVEATDVCERLLQTPDEAADVADANDVFSELQQQVTELDYDQVVDELEGVSFPGGPDDDEEVDLEDEADVDLGGGQDGDEEVDLEDVALDDAALDGGSDVDAGTDDPDGGDLGDDVDAKELFGEDDGAATNGRGSTSAVMGGADEQRIEEAVKSVEEATDGESEEDGADESVTSDAGAAGGTETGDALGGGAEDTGDDADENDVGSRDDADERTGGTTPAREDGLQGKDLPRDGSQPDNAGVGAAPKSSTVAGAGKPGDEVGELVDDLVTALESGAVGPDRRQRLREALGVESTHSLDVRLEYLQKRVDNLAAYTDAWEAFLAEEGTGNQFIEEIDDEIEALSTRVDTLEADAGGTPSGDQDDRIDDLERRLDDLADEHGRRLDGLEENLGSVRRSVEALGNWRDRVNDLLGDRL